jgi:hypothetical protein
MLNKITFPDFLRILSVLVLSGFFLFQSPALAQVSPPNSGAGANNSYNWAGYVANGGGYTSVSGSWTIPQIPATSGFTADATWVGIGGVNSSDLIQTGTQVITSASSTTYQAWYEMLPAVSNPIPITVNPGDSISASITESAANEWTISYNSSGASAEWIEEMPSQGNNAFIPLDNFGALQFSATLAARNGQTLTAAQLGAQAMTMVNAGGQSLAVPSGLGSDGASFIVSRSSASPPTSTSVPYGRKGWTRIGVGVRGFGPMPGQNPYQRIFPRMRIRLFVRMSEKR